MAGQERDAGQLDSRAIPGGRPPMRIGYAIFSNSRAIFLGWARLPRRAARSRTNPRRTPVMALGQSKMKAMESKVTLQTIPLLELPGKLLGERGSLRLLESAQVDPRWLCAHILSGRYDRPFIIEDGRTRRLHFKLGFIQSSMRIDDPFALDFAYTRKMMAFLLFVPDPGHVLMVGLGGGSLAKFCHRHLPHARLTVVEVNPDVITLSNEFNIPDDERLAIIQADAADYLPMAEGDTDVLLLDGFDTEGIAPTFLSHSFYRAARRRLRPAGILVANFAGPREVWQRHFKLLYEVFDGRVHLGRVSAGDNHVAFAFAEAGHPPDWAGLAERATDLARQFPLDFPALMERLRDGAGLRRALSDQIRRTSRAHQ